MVRYFLSYNLYALDGAGHDGHWIGAVLEPFCPLTLSEDNRHAVMDVSDIWCGIASQDRKDW